MGMKMVDSKIDDIPLSFDAQAPEAMIKSASQFHDAIKTRRTVRDFSDEKFPRQVIEDALRVAGTAPSGANMQPWHFVVVENPAIKKEIRLAAEQEEREFYDRRASEEWLDALAPLGTDAEKPFLETAPYLIAIFSKKFSFDGEGRKQKNYYTSESVGIATGFLIAALHLAGVATLTHTPSPMKFLNKILRRPDSERPFLLLVTGYPKTDARVPDISKFPLEQTTNFI